MSPRRHDLPSLGFHFISLSLSMVDTVSVNEKKEALSYIFVIAKGLIIDEWVSGNMGHELSFNWVP